MMSQPSARLDGHSEHGPVHARRPPTANPGCRGRSARCRARSSPAAIGGHWRNLPPWGAPVGGAVGLPPQAGVSRICSAQRSPTAAASPASRLSWRAGAAISGGAVREVARRRRGGGGGLTAGLVCYKGIHHQKHMPQKHDNMGGAAATRRRRRACGQGGGRRVIGPARSTARVAAALAALMRRAPSCCCQPT